MGGSLFFTLAETSKRDIGNNGRALSPSRSILERHMRRNNLCIAVAVVSVAIGLSESGWAELTNQSYPRLTCSKSQKCMVGKETSLAALGLNLDAGSAAIDAHDALEGLTIQLDNGSPTSREQVLALDLQSSSFSITIGDSVIGRKANPIVLEDIEPRCIHNCQIPEPSSVIFLTTALLGLGMKTRYRGFRR
jgi:hypothetical protein